MIQDELYIMSAYNNITHFLQEASINGINGYHNDSDLPLH